MILPATLSELQSQLPLKLLDLLQVLVQHVAEALFVKLAAPELIDHVLVEGGVHRPDVATRL